AKSYYHSDRPVIWHSNRVYLSTRNAFLALFYLTVFRLTGKLVMTCTLFKLSFGRRGLPYNKVFISFWLVVFLQATANASRPVVDGIWLSDESKYQLTELHQEQLVSSLRRITGLESLCFTEEGLLTPGTSSIEDFGSKHARQILQWAIES